MAEARPGVLVLVAGPSGAGKDTLIAAARERLAGDGRFVFVRRVVTRPAVAALEDHDSLDPAAFERARAAGAFSLSWQAHGHHYGLPASLDEAIGAGRIGVANVSRAALPAALERYERARILLVTAGAGIRARRLAARGRETEAEIAARLQREAPPAPAGAQVKVVDNSGPLAAGAAAFVAALAAIAGE